MKALITGAVGQVGGALLRTVPSGVRALGVDHHSLDICNASALARILESEPVDILINTAAFTAVDQAESNREQAFAVNAHAVGLLAQACRKAQVRLIHISTDFVFDGAQGTPYPPDAATNPLSVYGASKREGERLIAAVAGLDYVVIRTGWVYASAGRNFVLTMLRLFQERSRVNVVCDQIGTPTSAVSLARCIWLAAANHSCPPMLHFSDAGVASWYDFALAIYEEAQALGMLRHAVEIAPITTDQYPTPAVRPRYSVLDKAQTWRQLDMVPEHWRHALRSVLAEVHS